MASHNDLRGSRHIPDFPDQSEITGFLRSLLEGEERTQVTWAADAGIPYNTLTNWFTKKPPLMSAEAFLRLVIAANGAKALTTWLANYGGTWHNGKPNVERPVAVRQGTPDPSANQSRAKPKKNRRTAL